MKEIHNVIISDRKNSDVISLEGKQVLRTNKLGLVN